MIELNFEHFLNVMLVGKKAVNIPDSASAYEPFGTMSYWLVLMDIK